MTSYARLAAVSSLALVLAMSAARPGLAWECPQVGRHNNEVELSSSFFFSPRRCLEVFFSFVRSFLFFFLGGGKHLLVGWRVTVIVW